MTMTEILKEQEEQQTPVTEAPVDRALWCRALGIDPANEELRMMSEAEATSQSFQKMNQAQSEEVIQNPEMIIRLPEISLMVCRLTMRLTPFLALRCETEVTSTWMARRGGLVE